MTVMAHRRIAWTLGFFGFAVRLGLAIFLGLNSAPESGSDEQEYDTYAWNLAQGRGYRGMSPDVADRDHLTAYRPPGTSLIWAGLFAVFGHRYDVVRISNCLAGAGAVYLVFEIGRRCFSDRVGLFSAAAYAVFPTAVIFTVDLLSEALGTVWFLAFLVASLWFAERPDWRRGAVAGLFLGAAILTRANSVLMLPLFVVWAVWQFRRQWRALAQAAVVPLFAVALLAPWTMRNYFVFHRFIPLSTTGGSALLQGNNDVVVSDPKYFGYCIWDSDIPEYREALESAGDEVERDRRAGAFAVQWLKEHRDKWLFLVRHKLWRSMTPFLQPGNPRFHRIAMLVTWGPVIVLSGIAFFPSLVRFLRDRRPGWLIHLAILHWVATTIIFYGYVRYRHPIEPLCILLAVAAVAGVIQRFHPSREMC
jgi:4-amino-4-deoxy-L-arabinose transferase-like glycosyltransferase